MRNGRYRTPANIVSGHGDEAVSERKARMVLKGHERILRVGPAPDLSNLARRERF